MCVCVYACLHTCRYAHKHICRCACKGLELRSGIFIAFHFDIAVGPLADLTRLTSHFFLEPLSLPPNTLESQEGHCVPDLYLGCDHLSSGPHA